MQFGQKCAHKIGTKEDVAAEEIMTTTEKLSTLHRDSRKTALRASQKLARPHPWRAQGCRWESSLETLGSTFLTGVPRKLFFQDLFHHAQPPRHSKATVAMIQGGSATAQAGGRP